MNATSLARLDLVHPELKRRVLQADLILQSEGIFIEVVQGLRTWPEQDALYAQGRTVPGPIVTKVKGGGSSHNYGLAVDVCPDKDLSKPGLQPNWDASHPHWKRIVEVMESVGLKAGARWRTFPDNPHFEWTGKFERIPNPQLKAAYLDGGIEKTWEAVNA